MLMGSYTKVAGLVQGNRPVYKRHSTMMYLFYWPDLGYWNIYTSYTVNAAYVASVGTGVLCPDQEIRWQSSVGGTFTVVRAGAP